MPTGITFGPSFFDSDGIAHKTIEDAQRAQLRKLVLNPTVKLPVGEEALVEGILSLIVDNKEQVVDWLTTTKNSRPKARRSNGAVRKKRTPKAPEAPPGVFKTFPTPTAPF